jgi:hypothetical protein
MSIPVEKTEQAICSQIVANIERQAREGVKFPTSEVTKIEQQLRACVEQGKITQAQFNALIQLIKDVNTR